MRIGVGDRRMMTKEGHHSKRQFQRKTDVVQLTPVVGPSDLAEKKASVEDVFVSEAIGRYIVSIVDATTSAPRLQVGASPRGSLALVKLARARAVLAGRDFVTPEDVKAVAVPALAHRIALRPDSWVAGVKGDAIVRTTWTAFRPRRQSPRAAVTRRPSPKLAGFASASPIFLVVALATGRPELVVTAAPFAVILVAGLLTAQPPEWTTLSLDVERDRLVEGETITLDVRIPPIRMSSVSRWSCPSRRCRRRRRRDRPRLPFSPRPEPQRHVAPPGSPVGRLRARRPLRPRPRSLRPVQVRRPARWTQVDQGLPAHGDAPRARLNRQPQLSIGNQVARRVGQGIEFAGMRPSLPGGRPLDRSEDHGPTWRAVVGEHHPERNTDAVVFLDTFSDVRTAVPRRLNCGPRRRVDRQRVPRTP